MLLRFDRTLRLAWSVSLVVAIGAGTARTAGAQAVAPTKVACLGEATTHSAHRTYDPEYPELMGRYLAPDFKVEPSPANPLSGGMLFGAGTGYRIGNFGQPTGTSLINSGPETASTYGSPQMMMAEQFAPHVVVLGPYGPHESYAGVSVPDNFVADLRTLALRIVAFPSKPTVFISIPIARWGEDTDTLRRNIRNWTIQVAQELKLPTIDLWTEFLGKRVEFMDQNHLALAGRERMGRVVGEAIRVWKASQGTGGGTGGTSGGPDAGVPGDAGAADRQTGTGGVSGGGGSGNTGVGTGGAPGTGGATGTGGTTGTGGATGTGGTIGTGGAIGSGGMLGSGGVTASGGASPIGPGTGGAPTGGDGSVVPPGSGAASSEPAGCACSTAVTTRCQGYGILLVVGLLAVTLRRRRAHRR